MTGLIPFNRRDGSLNRTGADFENFYNMLDDFFSDGLLSNRSLTRDTFKIDVAETDDSFLVEAELPGVRKDEIDLSVDDDFLCISVNRSEEASSDTKGYIHRERRSSSMSRRVRLANARLSEIKAKLEDGVLNITIPKQADAGSVRKIDIE
ncbi:MAG: Hsp20 family protein [Clostridiales Family XIII bacterium]|jgi:HSP20 family protein|nr:Hsp20 family protein [Clostridiales Family XIII bacterium]